jgi:hypothetical protein
MSKELQDKPETPAEVRDRRSITDPHRQKELATNRAVRFYVEGQLESMEAAVMQTMTDCFAAQAESIRQLEARMGSLESQLVIFQTDVLSRVLFLEDRWYERIMRYLEWDILTFREWLYNTFGIGSNPDTWTDKYTSAASDWNSGSNVNNFEDMKRFVEGMRETKAKLTLVPASEEKIDRGIAAEDEYPEDVADDAEAGYEKKCMCGHTEHVHAFDGDAPCTVEGCDCKHYERMVY